MGLSGGWPNTKGSASKFSNERIVKIEPGISYIDLRADYK